MAKEDFHRFYSFLCRVVGSIAAHSLSGAVQEVIPRAATILILNKLRPRREPWTRATIIFPHQLFSDNPCLKRDRIIYLVEDQWFFWDPVNLIKFHKQKLMLHRATCKLTGTSWKAAATSSHYLEFPDRRMGYLFSPSSAGRCQRNSDLPAGGTGLDGKIEPPGHGMGGEASFLGNSGVFML